MAEIDIQALLNEAFRRLNESSRRLRELEERYALAENRLNAMQGSIVKNVENDRERAEKLLAQIKSIEDRMVALENEVARLSKLAEKSAKKIDVDALRELVELYSPFREAVKEGAKKKAGKTEV